MDEKNAELKVVGISQRSKLRCNSLSDVIEELIQQFVDDSPNSVIRAEIIGCLELVKDRFK